MPLSKAVNSIAVIGPNADNDSNTQYRYGPNGVKGVTVLEGIRNKLGANVTINYAKGCEIVNEKWPETEVLPEPLSQEEENEIDKAVDAAKKSDLAIVVLGDSSRTVGESASRSSLDLPGHQLELVQAIHTTGKPVIVVLINGRPISINWVKKSSKANSARKCTGKCRCEEYRFARRRRGCSTLHSRPGEQRHYL